MLLNNQRTLTVEQEILVTEAGYQTSDVTMTEETTVYLMNNLDLGARIANGNWEKEENETKKWTPIGVPKSLQ